METVVRYAPVLLDKAKREFPSLLLLAETEEQARENGRMSKGNLWTGRVATVSWRTPDLDKVARDDD